MGLLLPRNVTVQAAGDEMLVTAVDSLLMPGILEEDAAAEAKTKLEGAIASLK